MLEQELVLRADARVDELEEHRDPDAEQEGDDEGDDDRQQRSRPRRRTRHVGIRQLDDRRVGRPDEPFVVGESLLQRGELEVPGAIGERDRRDLPFEPGVRWRSSDWNRSVLAAYRAGREPVGDTCGLLGSGAVAVIVTMFACPSGSTTTDTPSAALPSRSKTGPRICRELIRRAAVTTAAASLNDSRKRLKPW